MNVSFPAALIALAFVVSWAVTAMVRQYALRQGILDIPNERSSHNVPTPRGGGLGIVAAFSLAVLSLAAAGQLAWSALAALLTGGLMIAGIGFLDDHSSVPARVRLAVHFIAALCALLFSRPYLPPSTPAALVAGAAILAALIIVWMVNLTNFMDGIDGIAGGEACFIGAAGAVLFARSDPPRAVVCAILSASSAGFLLLNWPPAKIFMGDVGSGFLGFILGVLLVTSGLRGFFIFLILFGVFIVDATITLLRRFLQGTRWFEAHRSHAYQHASRRWGHKPVTIAVLAINFFWLAPIAYLTGTASRFDAVLVGVSWMPLIFLAFRHQAGVATN